MPTRPTTSVIEHLRRAMQLRDGRGLSDGELLGCFIERRDETSLAALVQRHGPMVWGVCRRLLSHHDAEDAFQATFLVLVRKAASVAPREMVGNFLYGVAHRTALQARRTAARRRAREVQMTVMPDAEAVPEDRWPDVQPLLDEELSRLPDIYRAVIVLCDLEGRTHKEVARQLGCPEGTVAGRLARARTMLAKRLAQRGVTLSGGALAAVLAQNVASAVVPLSLVSNTIGAAAGVAAGQAAAAGVISVEVAALTEWVLKAMLMSKLKILAVLVVTLCILGTGAGVLTHRTVAAGVQEAKKEPAPKTEVKAPVPKPKPKEDKEMLQGTWHVVAAEAGGKHQANETSKDQIWVFTRDKLVIKYADKSSLEMTYEIDPKQKPKAIDLSPTDEREKGYTFKGIYELDGDRLKVYYSRNVAPDAERPARFDPEGEDRGIRSFVLKRAPAAGDKLPPGVEGQLKWGEPVNGLRAAMAIRLAPGKAKADDKPDLYLAVQNVSKEPIRLSDADVPADVNLRMLRVRKDGRILYGLGARQPGLGDRLLQPREVTFLSMFDPDTKLNVPKDSTSAGHTIGSDQAAEALKDTRLTFTGELNIEKAPAKAWTGMLVTGESGGAAAEIKAEPLAAPEKKPPAKQEPEKAGPATPPEVFPTQREMRRDVILKTFMVTLRNHHGDKNANALREFIDPRYLKEHGLTDRDLSISMPAVGSLYTIAPADDDQTFLAIVSTEADPKMKVREAFLLRVSFIEGKHYITPLKAPDPKTGAFTPWILRTRTDYQ